MAELSKEMAVTLPLILVLIDYFFVVEGDIQKIVARLKSWYIGYFVVLLLYLWINFFFMKNPGTFPAPYPGGNFYTSALTMLNVFSNYLVWLIFPLNVHPTLPGDPLLIAHSLFEPRVLFSLILLIAVLYLAMALRKKQKMISFCILWFFITLIPVSNVIPIANYMASRYLYIPALGFYGPGDNCSNCTNGF